MHGIVSLLDEKHDQLVRAIWDELKMECGLSGVLETPFPHFSWQVADGYLDDGAEETLKELAEEIKPFEINAVGVGIFSGNAGVLPVIYVPVLRQYILNFNHRVIWKRMENFAINPKELYHAYNWMPHITLAYKDVTPEKMEKAIKLLGFREINWKIPINNLTYAYIDEGDIGKLKYSFELRG